MARGLFGRSILRKIANELRDLWDQPSQLYGKWVNVSDKS